MQAQPFFIPRHSNLAATISVSGGAVVSGYPLANMDNLLRSRIAKVSLTATTCTITINLPVGIVGGAVAVPSVNKTGAVNTPRLRLWSSAGGAGTMVGDSSSTTLGKAIQDPASGAFMLLAMPTTSSSYVASLTIAITGAVGDVVSIPAYIAGQRLQFARCPQEPTIKQAFGGKLVQTTSGISLPAEPRRLGREVDVPFGSLTEADRQALWAFEAKQLNTPFFACLYPNGTDWQLTQYSLLCRFRDGLAYQRRGRTANHQTQLTLVEA